MRFTWAHCSSLPRSLWMRFLRRVDHTPQLGVTSKLAEGALSPVINVIDEDITKEYWPQHNPWGTSLITDLHPDIESWIWT